MNRCKLLAKQLGCADEAGAVFCYACGQPDEPALHDAKRCPGCGGKRDNVTIADALAIYDKSCRLQPDLTDAARAMHCAIIAREDRP